MNPFGVSEAAQVDLIELARWNHAQDTARDAYYADNRPAVTGIDYARRTAASENQLRYRARKKEQGK